MLQLTRKSDTSEANPEVKKNKNPPRITKLSWKKKKRARKKILPKSVERLIFKLITTEPGKNWKNKY